MTNNNQTAAKETLLETSDINIIQEWTVERGGIPVMSLNQEDQIGLVFENSEIGTDQEKISWSEFFTIFNSRHSTFQYKERAENGTLSLEYKIIFGEDEEEILDEDSLEEGDGDDDKIL